jgi:hypothetical protein
MMSRERLWGTDCLFLLDSRLGLSSTGSLCDTHELGLVLGGLEATVTHLGSSIDELEVDLLEGSVVGGRDDGLTKSKETTTSTDTAALDHDKVLIDDTIVREATHGSDGLGAEIKLSLTVALLADTETVDLLVHLSAVVEAHLTGTGDSPCDVGRMPGTDTSDLAVTTVSLTREVTDAETLDDTLESVTLGDTDDIDGLVHGKDRVDRDLLLKEADGKVELLLDVGTTVDLDLHEVGLALADRGEVDLIVGNNTDNSALAGDLLERGLHVLLKVLVVAVVLVGLLLADAPVLVETTLALVADVLSPDSTDRAETTGCVLVADKTDNNHGRSLDDGDTLEDLLLVEELAHGTVDITDNVRHASLVAKEGSKVGLLRGIVLGEGLALAAITLGALAGTETKRSVTRCLELAV